ncbi:YfjI family protein [Marinobacter sp.]|uniref:YfjI family protein n=1 Tax=Marinobacter sp. TaxID=50741 RepID=UPI000C360C03|nr:YfjI family protein [Marinobacter sp.]MAO14399.1 hypothetical protein [Marinobacter sp.]
MTDTGNNTPPPLVNPKELNEPLPLPDDQPPVMPLPLEALPRPLASFVADVSTRQQCPPDYVAVTALCALSAVVGNKIKVCPKRHDDWALVPNLWGAVVGGPASSKSPAMGAALAPLKAMEREAWRAYEQEKADYEADLKLANIEDKQAQDKAKRLTKNGDREGAKEALRTVPKPEEPTRQRLMVNDATIEKLGELLNENPNGLLLVRDELAGWLSKLSGEDGQGDRAFYLECYDGDGRYTFDRIGRGTVDIESTTLSIIGGIQPARIAPIIRGATRGSDDDGLIQRVQLAVWPDISPRFKWHDVPPDKDTYKAYAHCFHRLAALPREGKRAHFDEQAQPLFVEWMEEMQGRARGGSIHPVMAAHLVKMPKTVAALSLIFELIETGETSISAHSLAMALELADYLKSHAERLYAIVGNSAIKGAKLILQRREKLPTPFTARDIRRKQWQGLSDMEDVREAIDTLQDHRYLKVLPVQTGGRPTWQYFWNMEG